MQTAGIRTKAQTRHTAIDSMMSRAKDRMIGKAEKNRTANPMITDRALMVIPLPTVWILVLTASGKVLLLFSSDFILQNIWMV